MLPQLPCLNGAHQPKRSATAAKNAAASDNRSAIYNPDPVKNVHGLPLLCRSAKMDFPVLFDIEQREHLSSLS